MATDEDVLTSLDHYDNAVRRVADDFRARGAPIEPRQVRLDDLDSIVVDYSGVGQSDAYLGSLPNVASVEEAAVELADLLQEEAIESGDVLWPGCLPGHSHPPTPRLANGTAVWACPKDGIVITRIG
ncbi:hypothetical protein [Phytohabitans rumicis]|uniref:Uncharacterized protein n=1 Tax=Phytohabitans rumicis TaxID=1076125 RepID=A0A6V8LHK8_9ACTN|nr:hypothetical protein [Phytohabitans rumicis]GFJ93596.1 hypothetical protein Prum_072380 [Phytohabitans rumicis]